MIGQALGHYRVLDKFSAAQELRGSANPLVPIETTSSGQPTGSWARKTIASHLLDSRPFIARHPAGRGRRNTDRRECGLLPG